MSAVSDNKGGTKHYRLKKQKVKFYRRAIRTLKHKHFKTKAAKTRKQRRLKYLSNKLRGLTVRRNKRRTPSSASSASSLRRTSRIRSSPRMATDSYISPRIISIQPSFSPSSPLRLSQLNTSISPSSSLALAPTVISVPVPLSPPAAATASIPSVHSSVPTEIAEADSMSVRTDNSLSPLSLDVNVVPPVVQQTPANQIITPTSSFPDSLHLSDLEDTPHTQDSMASARTSIEAI